MTRTQREHIARHGPYVLRSDGHVIDVNGAAMGNLGTTTDWDKAVVAALNDVAMGMRRRRTREARRARRNGA